MAARRTARFDAHADLIAAFDVGLDALHGFNRMKTKELRDEIIEDDTLRKAALVRAFDAVHVRLFGDPAFVDDYSEHNAPYFPAFVAFRGSLASAEASTTKALVALTKALHAALCADIAAMRTELEGVAAAEMRALRDLLFSPAKGVQAFVDAYDATFEDMQILHGLCRSLECAKQMAA
jgi:hypothetical protein